jgi:TM2 domain-containing membrane protein YozV
MKLNLLFTGVVAMVFASCSTTIERNATAFGGGWGMNSAKESYKAKPSEEKKETSEIKTLTGEKYTQLTLINSQRNEVIPEKQLKAEDLFKAKEFKNLNFVQKAIVKKAVKKIEKKQAETNKNAPIQSISSNAAQGSGIPLSSDEQIIAILLCLFLGGLGIHRFYLGYTTIGVIQLLTAGGCGVWVLIDFIRLIIGDLGRAGGSASNGGPKSDNFGPMG